MAQYIDKDKIVEKIEKRFDEYTSSVLKHYDACKEARAQELGKVLTIINTLEVKEVESSTDAFVEKAVKHIDGLIEFLNEFGHQLNKEHIIEGFKKHMEE